MADFTAPIKPKKSSTASEVPQANDLEVAEIAINTADGLMWTKHTDNSIVQIGGGASAINDLSDVTITSATTGQVLKYDGAAWINDTDNSGGGAINDLSDVTITSATTGQVLKYNGSAWINDTDNSGGGAINDLSDVTITSATTGQVLKYNGSAWINDTDDTGGIPADLTTVAPVTAETLKYDGTNFVPAKDRSILSTPPAIGDANIDHDVTTSNFNVDLTTINEGDFLVIVLMTVTNGTTTPPAGWALQGTYLNITNGANDQVLKVYTRTATASETRPYAFQDTGASVGYAIFSVPGVTGIESVTTNTGNGDTATIATVAEKLNVTFATWIYSDPAVETHSQSAPGLTEVHQNPGGIVANARLSMGYTTEGTTVVSKHYTTTTTQNPDSNHQMINIQFAEVYSIDSLTDVDTTTTAPTAGDILRYDGTAWVNSRFQADDLIGEGPLLVSDTETAPFNTIVAEPAFQVASSSYDGCQVLIANTALGSTGPILQFANTRAGNAVIANDILGEIEFRGTEGQGDLSQAGAKIVSKSTGTAINNEVYAELGFETAGTSDSGIPSRRMTIKDDGIINLAAASCPTYADDTAAGSGGLVTGDIYKTSTGELRIKL